MRSLTHLHFIYSWSQNSRGLWPPTSPLGQCVAANQSSVLWCLDQWEAGDNDHSKSHGMTSGHLICPCIFCNWFCRQLEPACWEHYLESDNSYVLRQKISPFDGQGSDKGNGCQFLHEIKIINWMTLLCQVFDIDGAYIYFYILSSRRHRPWPFNRI